MLLFLAIVAMAGAFFVFLLLNSTIEDTQKKFQELESKIHRIENQQNSIYDLKNSHHAIEMKFSSLEKELSILEIHHKYLKQIVTTRPEDKAQKAIEEFTS